MGAKVREKDGAWWVVVHHAGRRTMRKIGADKRTAQKVAHEVNAEIALGKFDPDARRSRKAHPLDQALWDWHRAYRPTFSASFEACSAGYIANHLVPFFGPKDLRDLRDEDVLSFIQAQLDAGLKPPTIKNELSVLRRVLNLKQREGLINRHPCQHLGELMQRVARREASEVPRVDSWSRDEVATLLQVARDHEPAFYPLLAFLLQTGCRKGEALGLKWADVDFSNDRIHIRRALVHGKLTTPKSGKARSVVLSPRPSPESFTISTLSAAERLWERAGTTCPRLSSAINTGATATNATFIAPGADCVVGQQRRECDRYACTTLGILSHHRP